MSLEINKNCKVYKLDKEFIITKVIDFNYIFAKDTTTYETIRLKISNLSSKPISSPNKNICEDLSEIPQKKLDEAKNRYASIKPLIGINSRKAVEERASELNISPTTLYNWLKAYQSSGQLSSLASLKIKGGKDKSRLTKEQDEIISLVLEEYYLTKLKPTIQRTYELIAIKCKNADIKRPSLTSVRRRAHALSEKLVVKRREGQKATEQFEMNKGQYPDGLYPLHVLQINHTPADVILVDDEYRQELGRPWITMAIDIYSRMVAGFYISFEAPGYFATGQTLLNAILPKDKTISKYNLKSEYPVCGIPNMIHMDNAKEFRGLDLQNVCDEYGINIVWRPVGKARFGGHIERLLGTLSKYIHTLEGTTRSSIQDKREYDSQKKAVMTLHEFEEWLTVLIADVYHKKIHSQINMTPLQKYEEGIFGSDEQPPKGLPKKIEDEQFLYINLLPREERTIQKNGIQIDNINYYSEVLNTWIDSFETIRGKKFKKKFTIRRDPRDISRVWFFDPKAKTYYQIPYRNTRLPKVSIWEYRAAQKYLKTQANKEYKEEEIFEALERLRDIAINSKNKTKTQRKQIDRINKLEQNQKPFNITESSKVKNIPEDKSIDIKEYEDSWFEFEEIIPFTGIDDNTQEDKKVENIPNSINIDDSSIF